MSLKSFLPYWLKCALPVALGLIFTLQLLIILQVIVWGLFLFWISSIWPVTVCVPYRRQSICQNSMHLSYVLFLSCWCGVLQTLEGKVLPAADHFNPWFAYAKPARDELFALSLDCKSCCWYARKVFGPWELPFVVYIDRYFSRLLYTE